MPSRWVLKYRRSWQQQRRRRLEQALVQALAQALQVQLPRCRAVQ